MLLNVVEQPVQPKRSTQLSYPQFLGVYYLVEGGFPLGRLSVMVMEMRVDSLTNRINMRKFLSL